MKTYCIPLLFGFLSCFFLFTPPTYSLSLTNSDHTELIVGGDQKAQFPGGKEALNKWIKENLEFPKEGMRYGISHIEFTVKKNGSCTDFTIKKSLTEACDYAAVDCLSKMPKWEPAVKGGKKAESKVMVPVRFIREE